MKAIIVALLISSICNFTFAQEASSTAADKPQQSEAAAVILDKNPDTHTGQPANKEAENKNSETPAGATAKQKGAEVVKDKDVTQENAQSEAMVPANTTAVAPTNTAAASESPAMNEVVKVLPRIYIEKHNKTTAPIPQNVIQPYLTMALLLTPDEVKEYPKVVAAQSDRLSVGSGDTIYAVNIDEKISRWDIYHLGEQLCDKQDKNRCNLGVQAFWIATASLTLGGSPATLQISNAKQEVVRGDLLIPSERSDIINYTPHAPELPVDARVLSIVEGVREAGSYAVISLSRGKSDGLEVGHVLALRRQAEVIPAFGEANTRTIDTPEERYGYIFVFRVFEKASYALVMNTSRSIFVGDAAANP